MEGNISNWKIKQKMPYMNVWCRRDNPEIELEEYPFSSNDEKDFDRQKELYLFRKNHPTLVSAEYFTEEKSDDFCSNAFRGMQYENLGNVFL